MKSKRFFPYCKARLSMTNVPNTMGKIHADLLKQATPIGPNDTLIAAIAHAQDATLIARNSSLFNRVEALRMEIKK